MKVRIAICAGLTISAAISAPYTFGRILAVALCFIPRGAWGLYALAHGVLS